MCILVQLEQHISLKMGTCPLAEVKCPYYSYGCTFVVRKTENDTVEPPSQGHLRDGHLVPLLRGCPLLEGYKRELLW